MHRIQIQAALPIQLLGYKSAPYCFHMRDYLVSLALPMIEEILIFLSPHLR